MDDIQSVLFAGFSACVLALTVLSARAGQLAKTSYPVIWKFIAEDRRAWMMNRGYYFLTRYGKECAGDPRLFSMYKYFSAIRILAYLIWGAMFVGIIAE